MYSKTLQSVAIIVAHPDDETLWAGGTLLANPDWQCFVVSLCRKNDENRAAKFYAVLKILHAQGIMGNLDDSPEQAPLDGKQVEQQILDLLPPKPFDLVITHHRSGEYTRHRRHEETSTAVINLWNEGKISADQLWTFAYQDGNKAYFPKASANAPYFEVLTKEIWDKKYAIITEIYGFEPNSWEAQTTPKSEAFWIFDKSASAP